MANVSNWAENKILDQHGAFYQIDVVVEKPEPWPQESEPWLLRVSGRDDPQIGD